MTWKGFLVCVLCLAAWSVVARSAEGGEPNDVPAITLEAHWSIEGGMGLGARGEDLLQGFVMYWPDYANDGAIGAVILGGDQIPENKFAAGPAIEFPIGPVYDAVLSTILPDRVAAGLQQLTAPVRPIGFAGLPFDSEVNPIGLAGTGFHLWPNKHVQPTIRTEYISPSGNSSYDELEGLWTFLDVAFFF